MRISKFTFRTNLILIAFLLGNNLSTVSAQVKISESNTAADSSAMLEVESSTKGFLPPRMTAVERDSISDPAAGLIIYCTDCLELQLYNDTAWTNLMGLPTNDPWQCGDLLTYEGQEYATVLIGNQCWMAENLNVGTMINNSIDQTDNMIIEKYCYDDLVANCDTLGGLYQWDEMMQYVDLVSTQGVCPVGWHLPSSEEFKALEIELGMSPATANSVAWRGTNEGSKMATDEPFWFDGNLDQNEAFDSSGFGALPSGQSRKIPLPDFSGKTYESFFWTSTGGDGDPETDPTARRRWLHISMAGVHNSVSDKIKGYSVRCLQD